MQYSFLLLRHAQSRHNQLKQQWKKHYGKAFKQLPQYRAVKHAASLLDCPQADQTQCQTARTAIDFSKVALVLVSPLQRCLQTCRQLTEGHSGFAIVVEPLLACRFSASWAIGSPLSVLQKKFPNFDFSALENAPDSWMLTLLASIPEVDAHEMQQKGLSAQEYLRGLLQRGVRQNGQQFWERTRRLKDRLTERISEHASPSSERRQILVISHSSTLSFLLARSVGRDGKAKDKLPFVHCEPLRVEGLEVVEKKPLQPSL